MKEILLELLKLLGKFLMWTILLLVRGLRIVLEFIETSIENGLK